MYIDQTSILLIALIIAIGVSLLIAELLSTKKHLALREKDYKALRKVHEKNYKKIEDQKVDDMNLEWVLIDTHMHQLDYEVLHTAIHYLRQDPNEKISDTINIAYHEWIK